MVRNYVEAKLLNWKDQLMCLIWRIVKGLEVLKISVLLNDYRQKQTKSDLAKNSSFLRDSNRTT